MINLRVVTSLTVMLVRVVSILSIRGEVRDFYSDLPPLNVRALSERQHNALISAGIVLRF
jgi:hypothetical protein